MSAGGAPKPPLQQRDGRRALSRKPGNRLTPLRRVTRLTSGHKKPDPCASVVGFLSRVHMGRSDRRRVLDQRHLAMRQAHQRWWSRYRGGFGLRKTAPLLLHLLGLLGDFLGRLGSLLCFLRFLCHVFLVGWLA